MRSFFQWRTLRPPGPEQSNCVDSILPRSADRAALIFLGLGFVQVVAGLDQGLLRFIALALGLLLFGLPHGAIDHLVTLGLAGKPLRLRPILAVLSLYLLVVFAMLGLWVVCPPGAAVGFLFMTIYHWGQGDLAFERLHAKAKVHLRGPCVHHVHGLLRGIIPIGIPFIAYPDQASEFINACIQLFSPELEIEWHLWRNIVTGTLVILFAGDFWNHARDFRNSFARRVLVENVLLLTFFFLVPPLVAIGWYFAGWHGFRHMLRLSAYDDDHGVTLPDLKTRMMVRGRQAVPFTAIAVLMLILFFAVFRERVAADFELAALYLVLISALTLPHLLIVEWMDHREGESPGDGDRVLNRFGGDGRP